MLKNKSVLIVISIIFWLFLSLYPWQSWLEWTGVLRFLIGLFIYFVPGVLTFMRVSGDGNFSPRVFLGGFVVSVFATGLLGLLARLFQLNFTFIRWGFALWGAAALLLFFLMDVKFTFQFEKFTWWEIVSLLFATGGAIYFASIARPPLIHDDAFTYNALLYYYQHAPALEFQFPVSLDRLEIPRFWIAYWPLVEALISGFSKVDGLIIAGAYLPPALACFSFLGIYSLGRTLGLPRAAAGLAILAQGFSLMRLTKWNQPGNLFYQRLTEDKVVAAFFISYLFILLAVEYLEKPEVRKLILVGVAGLAMVFTHPIQFGMACMIVGVYGLPKLLDKDIRWKYVMMIGILAAVVLIPYTFRFGGGEYSQTLSFSLDDVAENDEFARFGVRRVDIIEGTNFYGISHYLTQGLPYEVSLVSALLCLFFFWKHKHARYVLAAFLVLGVSMFPYTGWIVGMFTTPFQLWRLTWLMPFGLAFAFLIWAGFEISQKFEFVRRMEWVQPAYYLAMTVAMLGLVVYVRPWAMENLPPNGIDMVDLYSNYVSTARQMNEMDVDSPIIIGGPDAATNSIIPSLTLKFEPLVFRVQSGGEQTQLWKPLIGENLSPSERLTKFQESKIEYLLIRDEPAWVVEFQQSFPENVSLVFKDRRFSLYQISP
ncbi:hypothetical protein [Candidatus Villigracilis affinis]|uniref:hypothetical protein n=1 Tax=Candidatus Villigracilis affinis TaxID=3140682 RepID=UPI002A1B7092|nr:hypothetical protein [Anaerolineales bacterium]